MSSTHPGTQQDEAALVEYMQRVDAGEQVDREDFVAAQPLCTSALRGFLEFESELRSLLPGQASDRFWFVGHQIIAPLRRGAATSLLRARLVGRSREVALKIVAQPPGSDGTERARRFLAEASRAARLIHPGIMPTYALGHWRGCLYATTALLSSGSLARRASELVRSPRRAAAILRDVAVALHYAHEQGVVHANLKPSNILFDASERPVISDFALSQRRRGASLHELLEWAELGDPSYLAPEELQASDRPPAPSSDVYSLGAILYELLTGRPPFHDKSPIMSWRLALRGELAPPAVVAPAASRALTAVCLTCLAREPGARYPSTMAVARVLDEVLPELEKNFENNP